jgi:glycosyltransferase involved in cell wall biosynthesis
MFNPFRKFKNIRPLYGINEDEFLFLSVKIFSKSNTLGLLNCIKAFYKSLEKCPNSKYLIIGEGEGRTSLETLIKKLGIEDKVVLPGWISVNELINYYRSSDATVHYFSYEPSISMSMLESLACGIPIIATNIGEVPNIVNENVGFLVKPSVDAMSDAMVKIQNSSIREKMSRNAWKLFKKKFEINVIVNQYIKLYKEIIEEIT